MNAKPPVVLKTLLQHRHLQTHSAFSREYDRVAAGIDPILRGSGPSKAHFYRWLAGELIGLPYPDHCRILEGMFPGWRIDQLFQTHDGGTELIPEPAATPTIQPTQPADQSQTMSEMLMIEPSPDNDCEVAIQRMHDMNNLSKFACHISPGIPSGDVATISYFCRGGQFVHDHYWRQAIARYTRHLTLTIRHRGVHMLLNCTAIPSSP